MPSESRVSRSMGRLATRCFNVALPETGWSHTRKLSKKFRFGPPGQCSSEQTTGQSCPKASWWAICVCLLNAATCRSLGRTWNTRNRTHLSGSETCAGNSVQRQRLFANTWHFHQKRECPRSFLLCRLSLLYWWTCTDLLKRTSLR
jgi:hypothetical protein